MTIEAEAEAFLAHYGKKGMKWGQRRALKRQERADEDNEIHNARVRQAVRAGNLNNKAAATYMTTTKKGQAAAQEAYARAEKKYLNHPDGDTAAKLTHGEKVANRITMTATLASLGIMVGAVAAIAVADSRH